MYIGVKFKDKNKVFKGRTYNFELAENEDVPSVGDIVRLTDSDWEFLFYGTRVRVEEVVPTVADPESMQIVHYIEASLDD